MLFFREQKTVLFFIESNGCSIDEVILEFIHSRSLFYFFFSKKVFFIFFSCQIGLFFIFLTSERVFNPFFFTLRFDFFFFFLIFYLIIRLFSK